MLKKMNFLSILILALSKDVKKTLCAIDQSAQG